MKKLFVSFAVMLFAVAGFAQAQTVALKGEEIVKFKEATHDFGKIKQGVPVTYDFVFKNISNKPIVIESATASCGCTTPVKPEKPIAKGKSDIIKAGFNAAAPGTFEKTIFVKAAGVAQPMEIKIKGEVLSSDDYAKYQKEKEKKSGK
jgi:hypothetical protein